MVKPHPLGESKVCLFAHSNCSALLSTIRQSTCDRTSNFDVTYHTYPHTQPPWCLRKPILSLERDSDHCTRLECSWAPCAKILTAHGYMESAVQIIIGAHCSSRTGEDFSFLLSRHGLPLTEGLFLWDLINLSTRVQC